MSRVLPSFPTQLDVDLAGLSEAAEPWLSRLSVPDQRIQSAPDARNIRYYQTTGLLDRPERYDGRTARYGVRHLLQLIAIRALQSRGHSLSQIQGSLAGATTGELQQIVSAALGLKPFANIHGAHSTNVIATVAPPATSLTPTPTALVSVELTPGVIVTIDTRVHLDIAHTISVLHRALSANDAPPNTAPPQGDLS